MTVLFEEDKNYYTLCAVITVAMQLFFFAIASTFKFDLVTDFGTSPHILTTLPAANTMPFSIDETAGSTNFILLAALTLALANNMNQRAVILTTMVIISRAYHACFLLFRVCTRKSDSRFDETRNVSFTAIRDP